MKKIIFYCICCLALSLPLPVLAQGLDFSLREAVEKGLQANPSLASRQLIMEQAWHNVSVAKGLFSPTVTANYSNRKLNNNGGIGSTEDMSGRNFYYGVRISQNLFNGFGHLSNLEKSKASALIEEDRVRQGKLELIANIQLEFLQLLKARADFETVAQSRKRIEAQLASARAFVKVGMAPYLNVLQNEVELAQVEQDALRVENAIRNHEVQLNKYLGLDNNVETNYIGDLQSYSSVVDFTEDTAIALALTQRPDLKIAEKSINVALHQADMTLAQYYPRISVDIDANRAGKKYRDSKTKDYERDYSSISLNIVYEFFTGLTTSNTLLGDRKRVAALKKDLENTLNQATAEIIKGLLDINSAREIIKVSRSALTAAQESYNIADKRYITNTGTIIDLLDAQYKLTRAEADATLALVEFHSARAKFFFNLGQENLGLE